MFLEIKGLCKEFTIKNNEPLKVLKDINLRVSEGEFISVVGPNACGKTTLFNLISGIYTFEKGQILIRGQDHTKANISFVFQNYRDTLCPWFRVIDNIALPLGKDGKSKAERHLIVKQLLKTLGVNLPLNLYPYQLSGGQQQWVAISRALVSTPDLLLLDEPFNALDYETRLSIQEKLSEILKKTGITCLFISHNIEEAIFLANRVVILSQKPSEIVEVVAIDLPQPRTLEMLEINEYLALTVYVQKIFRKVVKE